MGSSAKKKKEKKKDFQKPKLKVGKARPKNTNATDTSFSAKSIVFKQQNLSEAGRDETALFNHNLSLLSSKADTQRRDALVYLSAVCGSRKVLPQSPSTILTKAQPLILDGRLQVRQQLLKLLRCLPIHDAGTLDQLLLYIRAGMAHLSSDIRVSSLDIMDWLIETNPSAAMSCAGGWIKTLRTFQNLLSWHAEPSSKGEASNGHWSSTKTTSNLGSSRLLVHQLTTLSYFLSTALTMPCVEQEREAARQKAAELFPLWQMDAHMLPSKSNAFSHLNLFGAPRDVESDIYEDAEQRVEIFIDLGLYHVFRRGVGEAKKEGGEVGRAAALVNRALSLIKAG